MTNIDNWAFSFCNRLLFLTIPGNVGNIGSYAFYSCSSLATAFIPASVRSVGTSAFSDSVSLAAITVDPLNSWYRSVDSVLFDKAQTVLIRYPPAKAGAACEITNSVLEIASEAFAFSTNLNSVTFPCGVITIGDTAFFHCFNLTNVELPASVASIGGAAFRGCTSLVGIHFWSGPPVVGSRVFYGDDNAVVYYLPGVAGWDTSFGELPTAPWWLPYPVILTSDGSFGLHTNTFGFMVSWATNGSVVVEACTSLSNPTWLPLRTNTLSAGSCYFMDPDWMYYRNRFYRIRQQ